MRPDWVSHCWVDLLPESRGPPGSPEAQFFPLPTGRAAKALAPHPWDTDVAPFLEKGYRATAEGSMEGEGSL